MNKNLSLKKKERLSMEYMYPCLLCNIQEINLHKKTENKQQSRKRHMQTKCK